MDERGILRMLELLGSNMKRVKSSSGNIIAGCPLGTHQDNNPSFTIKVNPNGPSPWQCYSCGERSNHTISILYKVKDNGGPWNDEIHSMIKTQEHGSAVHRMKKIKPWQQQKDDISMKKPYMGSNFMVHGYEGNFEIKEFAEIMKEVPQYILDRGFSMETCRKWGLGFQKFDYPPRLFIPVFSYTGKFVGYSGRNVSQDPSVKAPKYKHAQYFTKDKYLYGERFIDLSQNYCFIMESFMDVLNLDQLGIKNCLAIMGTSMSSHQLEKIKGWFKGAVILPHDDKEQKDGTKPGEKMAFDCKTKLEQAGLKAMIAPIVPHKREILGEFRSPQDPGEWSRDDLFWVLEKLRSFASVEANVEAEDEAKREESSIKADL